MYSLIYVSEFWDELHEMVSFYENKSIGLGKRFLNDVDETLLKLSKNPFAYFNLKNNKRRIALKIFQSMIVYEIIDETIVILALSDFRSKPKKDFY